MKYIKGYLKIFGFLGAIYGTLKLAQFLIGGHNVIISIVCVLLLTIVHGLATALGEGYEA